MTFKRSEISLAAEQNVNAHGGMTWDPAAQADYLAEKLGGPARGKAQLAIIQKLRGYTTGMVPKGHKFDFNDLVKEPEFRGIHYGKLAKAAEALAKKGRVAYDGKTITLTETGPAPGSKTENTMAWLSRGSRTGQMTGLVEKADGEAAANLKIANKFKGKLLKPTGELGNIGRGPKKKWVKAGNNVIYHDYVREGSGPSKKSGFTISASYFHVQGLLRKGFPVKGLGPDERGLPKWFVYEFARMAEEVQMSASAALLRESVSLEEGKIKLPLTATQRRKFKKDYGVVFKPNAPNLRGGVHPSKWKNYPRYLATFGKNVDAAIRFRKMVRGGELTYRGIPKAAPGDKLKIGDYGSYIGLYMPLAMGNAGEDAPAPAPAPAQEDAQVSAALLREDGGVTGGFNRHMKLMPDDTRDKIMQARAQEIEAFAADRGYDLRIVMAIAEVSMRMGRVPDLRQYGVHGEEALAIRHFIAGDILNLAIEDEQPSASILSEGAAQTTWSQLKKMKLNGFPLPMYLGAKNPTADKDQLTVTLRGKWKGRVIIKLNKGTDLYDLTFGRVRKYEWIIDCKVLGVEVGNLAHVLQRYVEYGEARGKKGKVISAGETAPPSASILAEAKKLGKIPKKWQTKTGKKEIELGIRLAQQGLISSTDSKEIRWAQKLYTFAHDAKGSGVAWWEKAEEAEKALKAWLKKHGHPVPKMVNHAWVIEDERPSASILSEASLKDAGRKYGLHKNADGSGYTTLTHASSKTFKSKGGALRWLKQRGYAEDGSRLTEAVYNISATPAASKAGTDVHKMAQQLATAIAPFLRGRYQTVQAQDVFGQAQSIHIRSGNITPAMAGHNVAWHNDDYKFQAIVSGFNKDGSAGPKISVEQLSGSYKTKKMRKKTVKPGKESLMVNHIKKYVAGLMKDAPAPRAEDVSVSVLRGMDSGEGLDEAAAPASPAASPAVTMTYANNRYTYTGPVLTVIVRTNHKSASPNEVRIRAPKTLASKKVVYASDGAEDANFCAYVLAGMSEEQAKKFKTKVRTDLDWVKHAKLAGVAISRSNSESGPLYKMFSRVFYKKYHEDMAAARALPGFTDLLGSKKLDALHEVAAPGFSGTVKAMKGKGGTKKKKYAGEPSSPDEPKDIDNPWALSWHMWGKGNKSHYDPEKGKSRYKSPGKYAADKKKAEEVDGNLRAATRFAELLGCRLAQTQAPTKYTL